MNKFNFELDMSVWAAFLTWLAVFVLSLYFIHNSSSLDANYLVISALFIIYLVCFFTITQPLSSHFSKQLKVTLLTIQIASAYALIWLIPVSFLSILTIIWVAVLLSFVSLRITMMLTTVVIITWFGLYGWRWSDQYIWVSAILYGSFHFFAVIMAHQTHEATLQKQKVERLNKELLATQDLVQQASRQQERTRIARDLHDLVGHHLTALIINLEVARHQSEGPAKEQIDKSHALAKLLLSDVRDAISEIRDRDSINISGLIELWKTYIPSLTINTDIDETITWQDLTITQTLSFCILEAITNTMRHANATEINISISENEGILQTIIADDGTVSGDLEQGNGLTGMHERLRAINGSLDLNTKGDHLSLTINTPVEVNHDH